MEVVDETETGIAYTDLSDNSSLWKGSSEESM